jgi:hypothetical protein
MIRSVRERFPALREVFVAEEDGEEEVGPGGKGLPFPRSEAITSIFHGIEVLHEAGDNAGPHADANKHSIARVEALVDEAETMDVKETSIFSKP